MEKFATVEDYLDALPDDSRATLERVRSAIRAAAPQAEEKIAYGMPGYYLDGRPLVYYAGLKNHCSFFPASYAVMREFADELARFDTAKGTVRFPIGKPLPAALVKRIVKARIREHEARRRG